jgi:20S proteasome alpha/beta subunit
VTVVVAVKCPAGVVLATDSQATTAMPGGMPMKLPTKKIARLGKHVAYAGTGGQGAGQRVHAALQDHAAKMNKVKDREDTAALIRQIVNPIQQQVHSEWVQLPNSQPESWGAIFCGWGKEGPWIFEIDPSGPSQFQSPFASTGSGHAVAHAALISVAHFDLGHQSLDGAKALAYRAIESTCVSSAFGVGLPVQLAIVTEEGVEELADGEEAHTELMELVDLWKAKEVETLGGLAPASAEVRAEEEADGQNEEEPASIDASEIEAAATADPAAETER